VLPLLLLIASTALPQHAGHAGAAMPAADAATKTLIAASTPSDGAMLQGAPASFDVTFVQPTTLTGVTLTDDTDSDIPVPATAVQANPTTARVALPTLDPGTYRLAWQGMAAGKPVSGTLSFMVH
jgi:methionine-rich copper-binding protein CopC